MTNGTPVADGQTVWLRLLMLCAWFSFLSCNSLWGQSNLIGEMSQMASLNEDQLNNLKRTLDNPWESQKKRLPPFALTDRTGRLWTLDDLKGKVTFITIWSTGCAPCQLELPYIQKIYEGLKDRPDMLVITLGMDSNHKRVESFMKSNGYTFPVLFARSYLMDSVEYLSYPRSWIVDPNGILRLEQVGFFPQYTWWGEKL